MRYPLITLTTDFGTADHFVGSMKGVISSIAPRAAVVDITHEIPAFGILEGAFVIGQAWRAFPAGTIHVVVVDPGVGSARKPLLLHAGGQFFVGPDNGVFSFVFREEKHKLRHITAEKYFRHPVSGTFHGRDIFSPVGAHLAAGVAPPRFGKLLDRCVMLDGLAPRLTGKDTWQGKILKADRFGNLITNFHADEFRTLGKRGFELIVGERRISTLRPNFSEGAPGEVFLITGSSGYFEVIANQASAAQKLGCAGGARVKLTFLRRARDRR